MPEGDTVEFRAGFEEQKRVKPGHRIELVFSIPNTSRNRHLLAGTNMSAGATILCLEGEEPEAKKKGQPAEDPNQMRLNEDGDGE